MFSRYERLFSNEFSLRTQILCVKSSEVRYYLKLKARRDRTLERQKGKDSIHENKKNVYSY